MGLKKQNRIKKGSDFQRIYHQRDSKSFGPLRFYKLKNDSGHPRLGISISKKVGAAPKRNRIKRILRELFRKYIKGSIDLVVVVYAHNIKTYEQYQKLFEMALQTHLRRYNDYE